MQSLRDIPNPILLRQGRFKPSIYYLNPIGYKQLIPSMKSLYSHNFTDDMIIQLSEELMNSFPNGENLSE